MKRDAVVYVSL